VDYFEELINSDNDVLLDRLKESARFGVPHSIRGEVWKYLLGLSRCEKAEEVLYAKKLKEDFAKLKEEAEKNTDSSILKNLKQEIERQSVSLEEDGWEMYLDRIQMLLSVYMFEHKLSECSPRMVHLLYPLLTTLKNDQDADLYYCFCKVMEFVDKRLLAEGIEIAVARFIMLFRSFQNELCNCFEEEGISINEWAIFWLQNLLSRELPLDNVLRLWDTYFASQPEDSDLHIYVCIAILHDCKETLLEFEYSEIKSYLQNLPYMDMDQLIVQAYNIREEARRELYNRG
jgi:hypothetical protein